MKVRRREGREISDEGRKVHIYIDSHVVFFYTVKIFQREKKNCDELRKRNFTMTEMLIDDVIWYLVYRYTQLNEFMRVCLFK